VEPYILDQPPWREAGGYHRVQFPSQTKIIWGAGHPPSLRSSVRALGAVRPERPKAVKIREPRRWTGWRGRWQPRWRRRWS